jgi:threonine dehydrogenase-like Zn-dependent dehydrogenase
MGLEYCGIVEEVGTAVSSVKRPVRYRIVHDFDNTCPHCRADYQSSCMHREFMTRAQGTGAARATRRRDAVAAPSIPPDDMIPSLLTTSDVLGTGWFAADAANVKPGSTVVIVGNGYRSGRWKQSRGDRS